MLRSLLLGMAALGAVASPPAFAQDLEEPETGWSIPAAIVQSSSDFSDQPWRTATALRQAWRFAQSDDPYRVLRTLLDSNLNVPVGGEAAAVEAVRAEPCQADPLQTCIVYGDIIAPLDPPPASLRDVATWRMGDGAARPNEVGDRYVELAWDPVSARELDIINEWRELARTGERLDCTWDAASCLQLFRVHEPEPGDQPPEADAPYWWSPESGRVVDLAVCEVRELSDGWGAPFNCEALTMADGERSYALSVVRQGVLDRALPPPPPPPPPPMAWASPPPAPLSPPLIRIRLRVQNAESKAWLAQELEASLRREPLRFNATAETANQIIGEVSFRDSAILPNPWREAGQVILTVRDGALGSLIELNLKGMLVNFYNNDKLKLPNPTQVQIYRTRFANSIREHFQLACGTGPNRRCDLT